MAMKLSLFLDGAPGLQCVDAFLDRAEARYKRILMLRIHIDDAERVLAKMKAELEQLERDESWMKKR